MSCNNSWMEWMEGETPPEKNTQEYACDHVNSVQSICLSQKKLVSTICRIKTGKSKPKSSLDDGVSIDDPSLLHSREALWPLHDDRSVFTCNYPNGSTCRCNISHNFNLSISNESFKIVHLPLWLVARLGEKDQRNECPSASQIYTSTAYQFPEKRPCLKNWNRITNVLMK